MDYKVEFFIAKIGSTITVSDDSIVAGALPIDEKTVGIIILEPEPTEEGVEEKESEKGE